MIRIGTVMEKQGNKALVYTMDNEFVYIKRPNSFIGEQLSFNEAEIEKSRHVINFKILIPVCAAVVALFMFISVFAGGFGLFNKAVKCMAFVAVDINPSLELQIDSKDKVIGLNPINSDGRSLANKVNLKGMEVEDAVILVVATARAMGYITDENSVVLVSAMLNEESNLTGEKAESYKARLKSLLNDIESNKKNADLISVFIENSSIREKAEKNNISIGRELLLLYAQENNAGITIDEIKSGNVTQILNKLNAIENGKLAQSVIQKTKQEASDDTSKGEKSENNSTVISSKPENNNGTSSPAASSADNSSFNPGITGSISNGVITIKWNPLKNKNITYNGTTYTDFKYYKIVASTSPHPKYPENGYLAFVSDINSSSCTIDALSGDYNHSPDLQPNTKYYFSVTFVFQNGKLYTNDVQLTMPSKTTSNESASFKEAALSGSVTGDTVYLKWNPVLKSEVTYNGVTYKGFNYCKVVASTSPHPKYPENGYLTYFTDVNKDSWSFNPAQGGYNGQTLSPSVKYYFSITYVFSNGKFYSNDVELTMPKAAVNTEPFVPVLSASIINGKIVFNWTPVKQYNINYNNQQYTGFNYYKVVASTSPHPKYPENGYLAYFSDVNAGSWTLDLASGDYNHSIELISGTTYYFSITYVFSNGKIYTEDCVLTIP